MSEAAALARHGGDRDLAITSDGSRHRLSWQQPADRACAGPARAHRYSLGLARHGVRSSHPTGSRSVSLTATRSRQVSMTGGPPSTITAVDGPPRGATWGPDATIIFATDHPARPDYSAWRTQEESRPCSRRRIASAEKAITVFPSSCLEARQCSLRSPRSLAAVDECPHRGPRPADRHLQESHAWRKPCRTMCRQDTYSTESSGTLRAVPFDLQRLEVVGPSAPVRDGVATTFLGAVDAVVAANGSLAYIPGVAGAGGRQTVISVDRQGRRSPLRGIAVDSYRDVRVSPDGKRLALATQDDIWIYDFVRESLTQLTADPASDTQSALDPGLGAHHLYVKAGGLPAAVLATGRWHGQRRAGPHAGDGPSRFTRHRMVGRRHEAPVHRSPAGSRFYWRRNHNGSVHRTRAGEKWPLERTRNRISQRTLDGLPVARVGSTADFC